MPNLKVREPKVIRLFSKSTLAVANNIVPMVIVIILTTCAISLFVLATDVEAGLFERLRSCKLSGV
jgi:H2-forming N5,N10-methylenetetrahydromethanopterin dehydrogenase-like enzyme